MKTTKTEIRFFDVMDYEKEAQYLTAMHEKGWKFVFVSFPGIYHFASCQPQKVRYQLDYNRDGAEHKDEYQQMFADMGWEYLLDFVGYSYFRKPQTDDAADEEIFCDDDSRWEMMKRIFRGRMIPLILLFFATILPVLVRGITQLGTDGSYAELLWLMIPLSVLYLWIFLRFTVRYFTFKRKLGK